MNQNIYLIQARDTFSEKIVYSASFVEGSSGLQNLIFTVMQEFAEDGFHAKNFRVYTLGIITDAGRCALHSTPKLIYNFGACFDLMDDETKSRYEKYYELKMPIVKPSDIKYLVPGEVSLSRSSK